MARKTIHSSFTLLAALALFHGAGHASDNEVKGPHADVSEGQLCMVCQAKIASLSMAEQGTMGMAIKTYNAQLTSAKDTLIGKAGEVLPEKTVQMFKLVLHKTTRGQSNVVAGAGSRMETQEGAQTPLTEVKADSHTKGQLDLSRMAKVMRLTDEQKDALVAAVEEYNASIAKAKNVIIARATEVLPQYKAARFNKELLTTK